MTSYSRLLPGKAVARLLLLASLELLSPAAKSTLAQSSSARVVVPARTINVTPDVVDSGSLPSAQPVTVTLTLATDASTEAALTQFLADTLSAASPAYRQWLTPQQFAARFGATSSQVAAATSWAQAQGLTVQAVSPSGRRITLAGAAAQIQSAFAVSLHAYMVGGSQAYAPTSQPSLPAATAALFTSVDGLDTLPGSSRVSISPASVQDSASAPAGFSRLAAIVDTNEASLIALDNSACTSSASLNSNGEAAEYLALARQAAAQGITILANRASGSCNPLAGFAEVTQVAVGAGDAIGTSASQAAASVVVRPAWQVAPGLPEDGLRQTPDLTATSLAALAQALTTIATSAGGRLGNVNATLYALAPTPGLYTQPDGAAAGTWEVQTGLGNVDLQQLVTVYPRGTAASSTGLTISNYVPAHGQGTSFTASVTSNSGGAVPTGTVSFVASGVTLASIALTSGSATYSTNQLAGGNYQISANYSGDATYAASSNPSPATIYVSPEASNLGVTVSGGAVIGGTFNVIVTDAASSGVGQPTGAITVTLPVNGSVYTGALVPAGASSATATISVPATIVGTLTLSINCTANLSYSCSNPYTTTVTVSKATPTLSINYSPNPPVSGQMITLNASVTGVGTAPTPTGNVVFSDNNTILNAGALNNGATTTTGTLPTTAAHAITANYQGDPNYNPVSTTANSTTSGAIATSLSLSASATTVTANQNITFTALLKPASAGAASPTGSVQFFDNGTTLLGAVGLTSNVATFTTATLAPAANHVVTAVYSGDAVYTGSSSPAVTVGKSVVAVATTLNLTASAASYTSGTPVSLSATVVPASSASTSPSGSVQFFNGSTLLGSAAIASNTATYAATFTSGTQSVTAIYSGDSNYAASTSGPLTLAKSTASTPSVTALTVSPTTVSQGGTLSLSAIVTPTVNNILPSGMVQFYVGTGPACPPAALAASTARCTYTATTIGSPRFTASYLGDSNYAASTSAAFAATVAAPPATLTAAISPANVAGGATATVTATLVAANGIVPAGQITATILGVTGAVYNAVLPATANTSTVTVTIPVIAPAVAGSYTVVVSCAGTNFTCAPVPLTLASTGSTTSTLLTTTTALALSTATLPASGAETLSATVSATSPGASSPSGNITFFDGAAQLGTPVTVATSAGKTSASAPVVLASTASHSLTAVYSGDTIYAPSSSAATVVGTATTSAATTAGITLASSTTSTLAGAAVTFTATVTGLTASGAGPSGMVSFYAAGPMPGLLGSAALGVAGSGLSLATFTTSGLPAGSVSVYAVYGGDTNFTTATSNSLTIGLDSFTVTFVPQSLTVSAGLSGQSTVVLGAINGFSGSVTLGCIPPPNQLMTCSFSQPTLVGGGSSTLTINTTAPKKQQASLGLLGGVSAAALLVCLLPFGRRRRLPIFVLTLLATTLLMASGCSTGTVLSTLSGGTPLGTSNFTITAAGSDGIHTVQQTYLYQVTVQ